MKLQNDGDETLVLEPGEALALDGCIAFDTTESRYYVESFEGDEPRPKDSYEHGATGEQ